MKLHNTFLENGNGRQMAKIQKGILEQLLQKAIKCGFGEKGKEGKNREGGCNTINGQKNFCRQRFKSNELSL